MSTLSLSFNAYSMQTDAKQAELSWDDEEFVVPPVVTAPAPAVKNEPVKKETEVKPIITLKPSAISRSKELTLLAQHFRHKEDVEIENTRILFNRAIESAHRDEAAAVAKKDSNLINKAKFEQAKAYQGLAKTYSTSDPKKALTLFDQAIKLAPHYPDFYFSAGDTAGFRFRDINLALDYFQKGFNLCVRGQTSKRTMYYASLGTLYQDVVGDLKTAKKYYKDGLNFTLNNVPEQSATFHRFVGNACKALNQKKEAFDNLLQAIKTTKAEHYNATLEAHASFAQILLALDDKEEAQKVFAAGLAYAKDSKSRSASDLTHLPIFYDAYGCFCMDIGKRQQAKQIFEEGVKECADIYAYETSQLYKHFGMWHEEAQNLEDALQAYHDGFNHAQRRKPAYCSELATKIAEVLRKQGDTEKSIEYELKAIELQEKPLKLKP